MAKAQGRKVDNMVKKKAVKKARGKKTPMHRMSDGTMMKDREMKRTMGKRKMPWKGMMA